MEYYRKYKCAMSNNWDDQNFTNLKKWLVLDSQYTVDIFCNTGFFNNIKKTYDHIILKTNKGSAKVN